MELNLLNGETLGNSRIVIGVAFSNTWTKMDSVTRMEKVAKDASFTSMESMYHHIRFNRQDTGLAKDPVQLSLAKFKVHLRFISPTKHS